MRYFLRFFLVWLGLVGVGLALGGCSATHNMQVLVRRPATVPLPPNLTRLVVVNRSQGGVAAAIEGVLSGEVPGLRQSLAQQCVSGVSRTLTANRGLQVALGEQNLPADRGSAAGFGRPLPWEQVQDLAQRAGADAVLTLEYFDCAFTLPAVSAPNALGTALVAGNAQATAGFRLYVPATRQIFYENSFQQSRRYQETANSYAEALKKLVRGSDALNQISYELGQRFARRLTAYSTWEDRLMFTGGPLTTGQRLALTNNWQQAADAWTAAYQQATNAQEKGRLAYNLALGYEVLGDLLKAKEWVSTAYVVGGERRAQDYAAILDRRLAEEAINQQREGR